MYPVLKLSLLCLLTGFVFGSCSKPGSSQGSATSPNIIYIMVDDLGYGDLGIYGQQVIQTPNIDRMAKEGLLFTNHYAGSTVCAPSRSVLMTGQHTGHTLVRGNDRIPLRPGDTTVAEVLKSAGYETALIGKWGLGEPESSGIPNRQGFDYFYGYLNQVHAHNSYPHYLWENESIDSLDNIVEFIPETYAAGVGGVAREKRTHSHDKFMEKSRDFISKEREEPFFLYLALTIPHANNEAGYFDAIGIEVPDLGQYANEEWPTAQKAHAAAITYMDKGIGELLDLLKELQLDSSTVVFFTSDNGPHKEGGAKVDFFDSNGPLRGTKRDLYEGGIRVPLLVRWPGIILSGTTTDHISAFQDFLPTACDIAGVTPPQAIDGISYYPTLIDSMQMPHPYLYWEFFEQGGKQAVRWENWKAIRLDMDNNPNAPIALYNLAEDLEETTNIADQHPDLVDFADKVMREAHMPSEYFQFAFEEGREIDN